MAEDATNANSEIFSKTTNKRMTMTMLMLVYAEAQLFQ
jgi:hypothetical protein